MQRLSGTIAHRPQKGKNRERYVRSLSATICYTKTTKRLKLIAPAILENNRTLVHVRAIAEAFGADVEWNGDTGLIEIKSAAE